MQDTPLARLVDQVRSARAEQRRLSIRGGDTKRFYGGAPVGEPLDMRPLAGIASYEPTELVVTARAGTPLAELETALAGQGQWLAFEPPRFAAKDATASAGTVGGMVAAGLAGPSRAAVGGVREHVLGATLLNGRAEVLSFGGQVMKNVAGYDVSRLLAGSLGVLGAICEVSLKVLPKPPALTTLRFEMDQPSALRRLAAWAGKPLPLHASAWWHGMLVLRLAGAQAAVQSAARTLGGGVVETELATRFWDGLRDQHDEFFVGARARVGRGATLWRIAVPPTAPPLPLEGDQLVEWHGALRWLCSRADADTVREAASAAGGHATMYLGGDRSAGAFAPLSGALQRIHRELKRAFDPDGVFNVGRLDPGF